MDGGWLSGAAAAAAAGERGADRGARYIAGQSGLDPGGQRATAVTGGFGYR